MVEVIFVEILDKHDRVKERHRCASFPVLVGRSYINDIIVGDHQVCPEHMRIERDAAGQLWIEDLGSVNGVLPAGTGERSRRIRIQCDTKVHIGGTTLRFRSPTYKVADTVPSSMQGMYWRASLLSRRSAALASLLMVLVTLAFVFQGFVEPMTPARYLNAALMVFFPAVVFVLLWGAIWSLLSRIAHQRTYFVAHFTIGLLSLCCWFTVKIIVDYLAFSFDSEMLASTAGYFLAAGLITAALFGHLSFCSTRSVYQRLARAGGFAGLLVGVAFLMNYTAGGEFSSELDFNKQLKPPAFALAEAASLPEFLAEASEIKASVDELARE